MLPVRTAAIPTTVCLVLHSDAAHGAGNPAQSSKDRVRLTAVLCYWWYWCYWSVVLLVTSFGEQPTWTFVVCPPAEPRSVSTVSLPQRLPFPVFPLRASLPPLVQAPGPVLAAAPPAEYHSDSAESLEEIPVVLAKLGSSSSAAPRDTSMSSHRVVPAFPLPSPQPRTKRKTPSSRTNKSPGGLRFEMASTHLPTVFVSRASGEAPEPRKEELSVGRRQTGSRPGTRPTSHATLGSGGTSWMEP